MKLVTPLIKVGTFSDGTVVADILKSETPSRLNASSSKRSDPTVVGSSHAVKNKNSEHVKANKNALFIIYFLFDELVVKCYRFSKMIFIANDIKNRFV